MRVLIVGLGSIAKKHIEALKKIRPDVELYALRSDFTSDNVPGVINVFQPGEIPALNIDFIIISNPTYKHKETIGQLLYLNIPLFIEKPLFDNLDGEVLLQAVKEKQISTYVACNLRFLECLGFTKTFISDKRVNEVNIYCGSYLPDWRPGQDFRKIYSANKEMGGGVHIDLIHELDYAYWLFGKPLTVRSNTYATSSLKISAVDYANFLFHYPQFNINIILNYFRRDPKRSLEVLCEDGTVSVNLLKNEVYWNGELIFRSNKTITDTYTDQMRFFIEEILTRGTTFNTVDEAYEILKICLAQA